MDLIGRSRIILSSDLLRGWWSMRSVLLCQESLVWLSRETEEESEHMPWGLMVVRMKSLILQVDGLDHPRDSLEQMTGENHHLN